MILPDTPCQCGEVHVDVAAAVDAGDIDAVVLGIDGGDVGFLDAVSKNSDDPGNVVEGHDSYGHVDPCLVAPLVTVSVDDVVPASDDAYGGEKNVARQEKLVELAPDGKNGQRNNDAEGECSDDTGIPVRKLTFLSVGAFLQELLQVDGGVKYSLQHTQESYPTMNKEESHMRPVGQPKQDIVPAAVENGEGQVREAENTHAVGDICSYLGPGTGKPGVVSISVEADGREYDVNGDDVEDEEGLAASGDDGETEGGNGVAGSEGWGIDHEGVEGADPGFGEGDETEEGEANGDYDASDEDDKAKLGL